MRHISTPPVQRIVDYPRRATFSGDLCTSCREDASVHVDGPDGQGAHCLSCRCGDCR